MAVLALYELFTFAQSSGLPRMAKDSPQPIVNLTSPMNVAFKGTISNDFESFLNIRYGEETSGINRFAPPKPYQYSHGSVIDASKPGAACPQQRVPVEGFPLFDNVTNISEGCLTLRVDRPVKTEPSANPPVMVYIYGGGDTVGQIYDSA